MRSTPFTYFAALALFFMAADRQNLQSQEIIAPEIGDPYPLEICILSGETMEEDYELIDNEGQEIRVCCSDCQSKFTEEAYIRIDELNASLAKEQIPFYPLKKCVVTGKSLSDGSVDFVFRNRLFRLSSDEAKAQLKKNPGKYFADLDEAVIEKQKDTYPLETCVISGETLGDDAIDHVVANQLIRLADFDQLSAFDENPGKYLAIIREAK